MNDCFEMNARMSPSRLLSDKPNRDDSRFSRTGKSTEQKLSASEFKAIGKPSEIPVKMLIAQEMSKEVNHGGSQPNLVAKLMGLDALPDPSGRRNHQSYARVSAVQQDMFLGEADPDEFKDVYETRKKRSVNLGEHENDKKMDLVQRKFTEAKRLSMDGKLRQSKQFQDALEVLSSNKDLFLKCLQDRTSMCSQQQQQQLNNWRTVHPPPPSPETKRITVLLPSKFAGNHNIPVAVTKEGNQVKKDTVFCKKKSEKLHSGISTQPTRIVVLKPGAQKINGAGVNGSTHFEQSRQLFDKHLIGTVENAQSCDSGEVANAAGEQMLHGDLGRMCRDDTLISPAVCNGYVGYDSPSLPDGNPRNADIVSPLSRHSWDCVNRLGSPCTSPSHSQISYSPDSLVCQEAKKRLSERWATLAYGRNGICCERRLIRTSSKSLGEMLALSEAKRGLATGEEGSSYLETEGSKAQLAHQTRKGDLDLDESPRNLARSNSVPVCFPEFGTRLGIGTSVSKGSQDSWKQEAKTTSVKSFKGVLSGLFFSRSTRSGLEKAGADEETAASFPNECSSIPKPSEKRPSSQTSFSAQIGTTLSPPVYGGHGENQNQPSPVSVLDPPFGDECLPQCGIKANQRGGKLVLNSYGSKLIGKSPAIGTVPRTISCDDDPHAEAASSGERFAATRSSNGKPDWTSFAKTLLSVSGLEEVALSEFCPERWYSPQSPLDPSLRDKYIDLKDKEMLYEANRRRCRSTRKLVFDCVNAALLQIAAAWLELGRETTPGDSERSFGMENTSPLLLGDKVLSLLNSWFCSEAQWMSDDGEEDNSMAAAMVVKNEVAGWRWMDQFNDVNGDIAGELLEDLVHEVVVEFGC